MPAINRDRFSGFADLYTKVRPRPPEKVVEIALGILGREGLDRVVDLGSGTGLSTALWRGRAREIVGIEPTADMRVQAQGDYPDLDFRDGTSYATGLETGSADVVTSSQSFHWMEPRATLREVGRIMKTPGLFMVYDNHWPVNWYWEAERAYGALVQRALEVVGSLPEGRGDNTQFPKGKHRENLELSGIFAHVGTVHFDHEEPCTGERFVGIALSQGLVQTVMKHDPGLLEPALGMLKEAALARAARPMRVGYTLHYGIKAGETDHGRD